MSKKWLSIVLVPFLALSLPLFSVWGSLGEGTGHQRVVEILGYPVPEIKVHINEGQLPTKTKQLDLNKVKLLILNNEEVVSMQQVQKLNYISNPSNFGNLKNVLVKDRGVVSKDDIMALVTK